MGETTDRGISTALGYALVIGVITLLITMLFVSMAGFVEQQERETTQSTLETVGHNLVADIDTADRLATNGDRTDIVKLETVLPGRIVDSQYTILVNASENGEIHLWTHDPEIHVTVSFATDLPVEETRVQGGTLRIEYDAHKDQLVIRDD